MALTEDLSLFLNDFGVNCTAGAVTALGILDMPSQVVADGVVLTTDYMLTARAVDFGNLIYGAAITVNGVNYTVRDNRLTDDGAFCEITLQKTATDVGLLTDPTVDGGGPATVFPDGNVWDGGTP
jgi:hypothetical protein